MIELDYVQFALDNYKAPVFAHEEFTGDLNKVIVLKKSFRRFTNDGLINERLCLNMITLLLNQFGVHAANQILFFKVEPEHHNILKTFLTYLNSFIPNSYVTEPSTYDKTIVEKLKDISCRSCLT